MRDDKDVMEICSWMEVSPEILWRAGDYATILKHGWKWWEWEWLRGDMTYGFRGGVNPVRLTLDKIYLVEEKLTDGQWNDYAAELISPDYDSPFKALAHASLERKIVALGKLIRRWKEED